MGGPHVLSQLEMLEIMFNTLKTRNVKLAYVNPDWAMKVSQYLYNWEFLNQDKLRKSTFIF